MLIARETGVPCVFLTNGGGMPESVKRDKLIEKLKLLPEQVHIDRVILPHTPFR